DRYLHQLKANETSVGYWNVTAAADTNSVYGKFARGFDIANGKNTLYFDVDNAFLNNAALDGAYPVSIEVTYLDTGYGSFRLYYDSKTGGGDKQSVLTTCTNSGTWKKAAVTISDAYFGNRGLNGADFYIKSVNSYNVLFSVVELSRPKPDRSDVGLFVADTLSFDTLCINSTSAIEYFSVSGAFLNGTNIKIGPLKGYTFSINQDSAFTDYLTISKYGTAINKKIYTKFSPVATETYTGSLPITGGGYKDTVIVKGVGVSSRPILAPSITGATCNGDKDGIIDLLPTGGTGPFTYSWKSVAYPSFRSSSQRIENLKPADYSVTVVSQGGCILNAAYTVTEPEELDVNVIKDSNIICKGGNTTVTVNATGGTLPYTGTGSQRAHQGSNAFTITDANGCSTKETITLDNGIVTSPSRPVSVYSTDAVTRGFCDSGYYAFTVSPVLGATSYAWVLPPGAGIASSDSNAMTVVINAPEKLAGTSVSVKSQNFCGSSSYLIKSFSSIPANAGSIIGPVVVIKNQANVPYSVIGLPGLNYFWTVNGKGIIASGQNTPQVIINWNNTTGYGKVTTKAVNSCGSSNTSSLDVTVGLALQPGGNGANNVSLPESDETPALRVTPNPAKDFVLITFNTKHRMVYGIELTDLTGRILLTQKGISQEGANNQMINVQQYAAGVYFITFTNGKNRKKTYKLLKE
ncbi:MAG: T9SS type A sorting domain-containing protein, partial [Panacibacter sp.]